MAVILEPPNMTAIRQSNRTSGGYYHVDQHVLITSAPSLPFRREKKMRKRLRRESEKFLESQRNITEGKVKGESSLKIERTNS